MFAKLLSRRITQATEVHVQGLVKITCMIVIERACDILIINNLYWNQPAKVRIVDCTEFTCGVHQGCMLAALLFNVYSGNILQETLQGSREGVINNYVVVWWKTVDGTIQVANKGLAKSSAKIKF